MKCSLGISNFLEEISSLPHSLVFLCVFALIAEEGFLSLLAVLWNSAFRCLYLSFSPLLFTSLLFTAICKASPDSHFAFLHFFSMGMVLIPVSPSILNNSNVQPGWGIKWLKCFQGCQLGSQAQGAIRELIIQEYNVLYSESDLPCTYQFHKETKRTY